MRDLKRNQQTLWYALLSVSAARDEWGNTEDIKTYGTPTETRMSISANKIKGVRCALLSDVLSARMTREHNDTNMMAIGAAVTGQMLALEIMDTWLATEFSHGPRHQRRIDKMMALENE